MKETYTKNTETAQYVLFLTSEFSQWYPSDFTSKEGISFNCAEQYMMYQKAMLFGDDKTAEKILAAKTPKEQKEMGREVMNFDPDIWDAHAQKIVYQGNYYKFTQNPHLFDVLAATEGKELVEAAHYDPVWGIGLKADDPLAADPQNWKGKNWLGGTLTRLRDDLSVAGFTPNRNANSLMLKFNDAAGQRILYIEAAEYAQQNGFSTLDDFAAARKVVRREMEAFAYRQGLHPEDVTCRELDHVAVIKGHGEVTNASEEFEALNPSVFKDGIPSGDYGFLLPPYAKRKKTSRTPAPTAK